MTLERATLRQIQSWMQSMLMHPGDLEDGLASPAVREHLDASQDLSQVIRPSRSLTSAERLEIYIDAYYERLMECLREEFVATRCMLGDDLFNALAFGYLQRHPSRSYTLANLGTRFSEYLATTRLHEHQQPDDAIATWGEAVIELATFERLLRDVFDGPGEESHPATAMAELAGGSVELGSAVLVPSRALRLDRYEHAVHEYWQCARADEPAQMQARRVYLAVHRRAYVVERVELSLEQFLVLTNLAKGECVSKAVVLTANSSEARRDVLEAGLQSWFTDWLMRGWFIGTSPSAAAH